jgi:hypothetical protein
MKSRSVYLEISIEVPEGPLHELMQYLRDYEQCTSDVHFRAVVKAPSMTLAQMRAVFDRVDPPIPENPKGPVE